MSDPDRRDEIKGLLLDAWYARVKDTSPLELTDVWFKDWVERAHAEHHADDGESKP